MEFLLCWAWTKVLLGGGGCFYKEVYWHEYFATLSMNYNVRRWLPYAVTTTHTFNCRMYFDHHNYLHHWSGWLSTPESSSPIGWFWSALCALVSVLYYRQWQSPTAVRWPSQSAPSQAVSCLPFSLQHSSPQACQTSCFHRPLNSRHSRCFHWTFWLFFLVEPPE